MKIYCGGCKLLNKEECDKYNQQVKCFGHPHALRLDVCMDENGFEPTEKGCENIVT
jgi:hypothetical protein